MCGRFTLLLTWAQINALLSDFVTALKSEAIPQIEHAPARYNIAPTQPILVLRRVGGTIQPALMRWGLVPEWVEDPNDFPLIINARAETLSEKTSFKSALKNTRCIIPASGYYEWQKNPDGSKTPTYITRKDGRPFMMGGLYSTWVGDEGEEVDTAVIITVDSNVDLKPVHHRSPALLSGEGIDMWLDSANVNAPNAHKLLRSIPDGVCQHHAVTVRVNSPRNDDADLIVPAFEQFANKSAPKKLEKAVVPNKPANPTQLDLF